MENIEKIYWECHLTRGIVQSDKSIKVSSYNNLFGFPYMTTEKLLKIESDYEELYQRLNQKSLINPYISSFIESLEANCSDINLSVTFIYSPHSSSNILLNTEKSLIPYKKINSNWLCLNPSQDHPYLIPSSDLESIISSEEGKNFLFDFKFTNLPNIQQDRLINISEICQIKTNFLKLFICKPCGTFIEYYSPPDYPVKYLVEYMKSKTGYNEIELIQKQRGSKIVIKDLNLKIKDLVCPTQNLIYCIVPSPSEYDL